LRAACPKWRWVGFVLRRRRLVVSRLYWKKVTGRWFASNLFPHRHLCDHLFDSILLFVPWELFSRVEPDRRYPSLRGPVGRPTCFSDAAGPSVLRSARRHECHSWFKRPTSTRATLSCTGDYAVDGRMRLRIPVVGSYRATSSEDHHSAVAWQWSHWQWGKKTSLAPERTASGLVLAAGLSDIGLPFLFIPITSPPMWDLATGKTSDAPVITCLTRGGRPSASSFRQRCPSQVASRCSKLSSTRAPSPIVAAYQQALQAATAPVLDNAPAAVAPEESCADALIDQAVQYQSMLLSYITDSRALRDCRSALVPVAFLLLDPRT